MKPTVLRGLAALAFAACAPGAPVTPAPAPAPAPAPQAPAPAPAPAAAPAARTAPENWHLLDASDTLLGTGALRAERELLAGRAPKRTVVVAIIDSGVDTAHVDLAANLWRNPRERPDGRDDDGNGYVDDVRGWNFIGGPGGEDVRWDTFEVTRLYARCSQAAAVAALPAAERERCPAIREDYDRRRSEAEGTLQQVLGITQMLTQASAVLQRAVGTDTLTPERVRAIAGTRGDVRQARELYLRLAADDLTAETLAEYRETYENQLRYGFNTSFDPRPIVQDDTTNPRQRRYGNAGVTGPDAEHGTHVAGIVGAVRGNGAGVDGVAPAVQLMVLRAVPDGDERDKDVANAIRYAADNGAHIINMSFGKPYSPHKAVVDEAIRHADSLGVLMVHAAGNDGNDLGEHESFPTPVYGDVSDSATAAGGARAANWITVGATSWKAADSLVASFSNYGDAEVDLFAPGVDIHSTVPGGEYERNSGTSMAAPVVSGVAALLMAHYPTLTAADVKRILLESATRRPALQVIRPGSRTGELVPFGTLSVTGGVVNAYEAVRLAEQMTAGRQP